MIGKNNPLYGLKNKVFPISSMYLFFIKNIELERTTKRIVRSSCSGGDNFFSKNIKSIIHLFSILAIRIILTFGLC